MKLTISRESLLPVLERATGVVEQKSTTPVLSNVLLSTSEKGLRIIGTDLDTEISGTVDNEGIQSHGSTTVSAKKLVDICKALPSDSIIEMSLDAGTLSLKCGRSLFHLATLPSDDFPFLDNINLSAQITLVENEFLDLLNQTAYAMAQHDVRYYLNGLFLHANDGKITTVATDGHRLACCSLHVSGQKDMSEVSIIIPRKGINELTRLLSSDSKTNIDLELSDNHIRLQKGNIRFTSKLIDGKYPDYQAAIPSATLHTIDLDRIQIKETLSRVAILSNEKFRGVLLKLSSGLLTIRSDNPDRETAEDSIDINYTGDDFSVGFNVNYLLDAINNLTGDTITFSLNTVESSTLIQSSDNPNSMSVVMPVRL
ncbi:MAG: DNA polymerase III subunit beta [Thiotrichaceae bacterium]